MNKDRVSILGCGWLGFSLAQALVKQGHAVKGSTTTLEKIPVLQKAGIFCFAFSVEKAKHPERGMAPGQGDMIIRGNNIKDFFDTDVLVITLPFRRSFADPADYQKQISAILCESKNVPIVFTSSTSVYPDNMPMAFEDAQFVPDNERRQVLAQVEKDILKRRGTVVRLAGLYGAGRNIGNFLAGKKELSGGDSPVNLIHQEDAVGILCAVIAQRHKVAGEIFNVCTDEHPLKKDLYAAAAKRLNVAAPEFAEEKSSKIKIVTNEKVKKVLGYQFIHPDPMKDI